jgi:hypothetical protein
MLGRNEMDNHEYCCQELAVAVAQRQICPSMDEDKSWNVKVDAFTYALTDIRYCPFCGSVLPEGE